MDIRPASDGFDLVLRPRRPWHAWLWAAFLCWWPCGWLLGVLVVVAMLWSAFVGPLGEPFSTLDLATEFLTRQEGNRASLAVFMGLWLVF